LHRKPTQTFGDIAFSKDGKVTQHLTQLSEHKPTQELEALKNFIKLFNAIYPNRRITFIRQLEERNNDFIIKVDDKEIEIELSELVDRSFTVQMSQEEYDSGKWFHVVQKEYGKLPWRIDPGKRDNALTELIKGKISKGYSKSTIRPLWLIIFATFMYETEYSQGGEVNLSPGLLISRSYLQSETRNIFDEIWFTDLETRPVCVWSR
jgi:hypothetical protein